MSISKRAITTNFLLIFFVVGVFLGGFFVGRLDEDNKTESEKYEVIGDVKSNYNGVDVNILWEVWSKLEDNYIEENLDGQAMLDGAVKGLVSSLGNKYNSYLTPDENKEYLESNAGSFEGIGTTLRFTGEYTEIETPIEGFPAQKAGLRSGDVIVQVDGQDMKGKNAYESAEVIKGDAGTEVVLKVARSNNFEDLLEFKIIREAIDIDSISYEYLDEDTVKIKITQFTEENLYSFNKQWQTVAEEIYQDDPDSVIIDLRNNPGGYVQGVLYVLDEFFPSGTLLMSERDRDGNTRSEKASRNGRFEEVELVVLVNEGSASAAEIFAGAVQDHDRGLVLGMSTVGKGVEQQVISLSNGGSLHVVFQEWVLPNGRVVTAEDPIIPDIEIDLTEEDFNQRRDPQLEKAIEVIGK